MLAASVFAIVLAAALPPEEEFDPALVDKPELSKIDEEADQLSRHVERKIPHAQVIELVRGDTVFVEWDAPLARMPSGPIEITASDTKGSRDARIMPIVEITRPPQADSSTPRSKAKVAIVYPVRALMRAAEGPQKITATFEVRQRGVEKPIATIPVEHVVNVVAFKPAPESIELDRRAFIFHQSIAIEAAKNLRSLGDVVRLDRVDAPPPGSRVKAAEAEPLARFMRHRLRADIAYQRLRTAVESKTAAISDAALLAIGSLSKRPTGPAAKASVIEDEATARALDLALAALNDARIDDAEGILDKVRRSGRLTTSELEQCLVMLGAVYAARGRTSDAEASFGKALCVDPNIKVAFARTLYSRAFESAKKSTRGCARPLSIENVSALRHNAKDGKKMIVRASFGPDPYDLVSGGDIELWGAGGAATRADKIRAQHGLLEVSVPDTGDLENYGGQLLLKVVVRDVSGVPLATFGHPDPIPVEIGKVESAPSFSLDVPWWVWVVVGGVAVAGVTTGIVVASADREVKYGIGPIHAEF